ncbi:uncharacterized protein N7458_006719 [Penicillium daleae]|uniref:Uncharacterized protein n=1 Tax=Penicillium daleae TaxID=63821 RepID=A0AAD6C591_9EURO|nr:uncharacterized protein N7458_006719 [Penicillium daleae]KAJ5450270.1 hypothetical protein N7458_006719 [Penicillium daleae]
MADRETYKTIEAWQELDDKVGKIIQDDTGKEIWIANRALPPTGYLPAMTPDSIEKIKNLSDDLIVKEVED